MPAQGLLWQVSLSVFLAVCLRPQHVSSGTALAGQSVSLFV